MDRGTIIRLVFGAGVLLAAVALNDIRKIVMFVDSQSVLIVGGGIIP